MIKRSIAFALLAGLGLVFLALWQSYQPDPSLNRSALYYAENTVADTGAANIVAAVIVTYRGLDTLGEVTVLFLTAAIVAMVLRGGLADAGPRPGRWPTGELLHTGSRLLVPLIVLFGAYVFLNGHLTPGGGFQGGAIIASAMLLMLLTDPARNFSHRLIATTEAVSGLAYVAIGLAGMVLAGGFLDNRILPMGEFGSILSAGAIPLIYALIGLKVGAEFSSILLSLAEREE